MAAALLASVMFPAVGRADPFDHKMIPADAKWVISIDIDAARNTKSFAMVRDEALANENLRGKLDQIKDISGLSIPDGLNDITVFGKAAGTDAGVFIVHGKIDQTKTANTIQNADDFSSKTYRTYDVYGWSDNEKKQTLFAAFHTGSTLIIGHDESAVESVLDAMDGKVPTLKADSPLAAGAKSAKMVYLAAKDIPQLHGANQNPNPLMASVDSAWISVSEKGDVLNVHGELQTGSRVEAANVRLLLEGVKGMIGVAADRENADPVAKAVAGADKSFAAARDASAVDVDWPIPVDQLKTIIKAVGDKQAAKK
jgi:hypothetical protein